MLIFFIEILVDIHIVGHLFSFSFIFLWHRITYHTLPGERRSIFYFEASFSSVSVLISCPHKDKELTNRVLSSVVTFAMNLITTTALYVGKLGKVKTLV